MRVQYVITRGVVGGAQVHLLSLLEGFAGEVAARVTVGEDGYLAERLRALGVPVVVVPQLAPEVSARRDVMALRRIRAAIEEFRPDLVHTHSSKAGVLGRLAAHQLGVPALFTAHGWGFDGTVPRLRRTLALVAERTAARWTARVITVSDADRRAALEARIAPADKLVTVRNGLPDAAPRREHGGDPPVAVMVGRFEPQKDHATLIRALAATPPPLRVLLVGEGPTQPRVAAEVHRLGLADRVSFLTACTDVAALLARADVLVLASNREGLPLTVIEGMRAGLPVVATDVGGVREQVEDGVTGFLVARGDARGLADRLATVAGDPTMRARMGVAGRRRFEQHFTLDEMVDSTRRVYAAAVGTGGP